MLKNRTKFIIAFIVLLFGICLLNTNTVQAVEVTEEYAQTLLDMLPNEIQLDIKISEFEKANKIVKDKVETLWKENNIDINNISYFCEASPLYTGIETKTEDFYKAFVYIDVKNPYSRKTKEIQLKYSDSDKYNVADETFVKDLKIDTTPTIIEVNLGLVKDSSGKETIDKIIGDYYTNLIKDKSITVKADSGAGGISGVGAGTESVGIGIFKNGFLYRIEIINSTEIVPVVNVPSNISNDNLKDYVIDEIKKYYPEYATHITSINKGATCYERNIKDGYTINTDNNNNSSIIIRKEIAPVTKKDTTTNITLQADTNIVPANTVLEVEPVTEGKTYNTVKTVLTNVNKLKVFDINLLSNGVKIQPNGKVKISIPIPTEFDTSKLAVYRIADNGEKIKYKVTVENNNATFETDHFSTYVLAEEKTEEQAAAVKQGEKDNTPKTGTNNMTLYILGAVALITGAGITTIKKYNK